jgi:hypothetical protein
VKGPSPMLCYIPLRPSARSEISIYEMDNWGSISGRDILPFNNYRRKYATLYPLERETYHSSGALFFTI